MAKKWYRAIERTIFQLATLHLIIIAFQAVRSGDYRLVHIQSIMDFNFFFSNLSYSLISNILLLVPVVLLFFLNLYLFKRAKTQA